MEPENDKTLQSSSEKEPKADRPDLSIEGSAEADIVSSGDGNREILDEIATNDGAVIESLDTTFHGKPGWTEGENISGSNRADYYEARSNGKSDATEELDVLRKQNSPGE